MAEIKVLALDLDGTLTNDQKEVTPRTRAALDAAIERGVTVVLASGRPTAGITPLAKDLGLDKKGGCILSYNVSCIVVIGSDDRLYLACIRNRCIKVDDRNACLIALLKSRTDSV